jgi:hypothetical protein
VNSMFQRVSFITLALAASLILNACGKSVSGNTYAGADGVTVAFQSGGKATTALGGIKSDCTYTEDGKTVSLTCEGGEPAALTINDDGSLSGPPDGMLAKLTKQ